MRFFIFFILLLTSTSADAQVWVDSSKNGKVTTIHVEHETLASFLNYMHKKYGTTSTLPETIATDQINSDARGNSLLAALQRLLNAYNTGVVLGEGNSISHITILLGEPQAENNQPTINIGSVTAKNKQQYQQMRQRMNRRFNRFGNRRAPLSTMQPEQQYQGGWHRHAPFSNHQAHNNQIGQQSGNNRYNIHNHNLFNHHSVNSRSSAE